MCLLFRGSTVHKEEDKLSIVDEMAGPNVSFISEVPLYIRKRTLWNFLKWPEYRCGNISGVVIRGVPLYIRKRTLWNFLKWPEYRGGNISGVVIRGVPLCWSHYVSLHIAGLITISLYRYQS